MNYNNFTQETSRMLELMKYGMNESTSKSTAPRVEYSVKAADGLTYGIVNEGTKFYIKVAPKKETQIVNEDFDYIGGEMNKKQNEYKSYSAASKNLELKLMQINEAHKDTKIIVESTKKEPAADWQINETVEMRNAINRMNQISRNVGYILTEGSIPSEHTLPESPAKNPSDKKVNSPFTDTAVANGDKEFTKTETNYEKPNGTPYSKSTDAKLTSDKKPTMSGDNGNAYSENAQYAPKNNVTGQHPTGGKVTRADEGKRTIKLTEEQVLAWNRSNDDFMDKSHGTEIGSTSPYDDDDLKYDAINENEFDDEDIAGFEGLEDVPFPEIVDDEADEIVDDANDDIRNNADEFDDLGEEEFGDDDFLRASLFEDDCHDTEFEIVDDDDIVDDAYTDIRDNSEDYNNLGMEEFGDEDEFMDASLFEQELHDFGKHPAYAKKPMTLPPNKNVAPNGARDWNDESAEGEEPFGRKIGSSAPFEKAVQNITNSVMESLGF